MEKFTETESRPTFMVHTPSRAGFTPSHGPPIFIRMEIQRPFSSYLGLSALSLPFSFSCVHEEGIAVSTKC